MARTVRRQRCGGHDLSPAYSGALPRPTRRARGEHESRAVQTLDLVQWPAFVASIAAAWLVASRNKRRRNLGFWVFLASNVLWTVWGVHTSAIALIALQVCLAALNVRGLFKTDPDPHVKRED